MNRYIRTSRAAVAVTPAEPATTHQNHGGAGNWSQQGTISGKPEKRRVQTLWASRPLTVRAGRLVAVRLRGDDLRIGLATADGLRWVSPDGVLTVSQAEAWVKASRFRLEG